MRKQFSLVKKAIRMTLMDPLFRERSRMYFMALDENFGCLQATRHEIHSRFKNTFLETYAYDHLIYTNQNCTESWAYCLWLCN